MKAFFKGLLTILGVAIYAFAIQTLFNDILFAGTGDVVVAASLLAKAASDPEIMRQWSKMAFKLGETKTEFNESEIGYSFADDGPKPSQQTTAAPILYYQGALSKSEGGKYISVKYKEPLISDGEEILKSGRFTGQQRYNTELTMNRKAVVANVDEWFLGVAEEDVREGKQQTANAGELLNDMVEALSNTFASRKDWGIFFAMCAGSDMHHYVQANLRAGTADAAVPVAQPEMGLKYVMSEHPVTFVWQGTALTQATWNATQATFSANITTALELMRTSHKPTLSLLNQINRKAVRSNIIPANIKIKGQTVNYYLLLVSGRIKDLLEQDTDYKAVMNSAYQTHIKDHPLLKAGDVMYKNLIIRESNKLDEDYFSAKSSFNATGSADATSCTFNKATVGTIENADIDVGVRTFVAAGAAATDFGGDTKTDLVGRMFLLGANAIIHVVGKEETKLEYLDQTDYGRKEGVGITNIFGTHRVQSFDPANGSGQNVPQSFQIFCFQGD